MFNVASRGVKTRTGLLISDLPKTHKLFVICYIRLTYQKLLEGGVSRFSLITYISQPSKWSCFQDELGLQQVPLTSLPLSNLPTPCVSMSNINSMNYWNLAVSKARGASVTCIIPCSLSVHCPIEVQVITNNAG